MKNSLTFPKDRVIFLHESQEKKMKSTFKSVLCLMSAICLLPAMSACGAKNAKAEKNAPEVAVDLGKSELYTRQERSDAMLVVRSKFATFAGCELHGIRYAGDEANNEDNQIGRAHV